MTREQALDELGRIAYIVGDSAIIRARRHIGRPLTDAQEFSIGFRAALGCLMDAGLLPEPTEETINRAWAGGLPITGGPQ